MAFVCLDGTRCAIRVDAARASKFDEVVREETIDVVA
jgi:hypothetical protein